MDIEVELEVELVLIDVLVEEVLLEVEVVVPAVLSSKGLRATTLIAQLSKDPTALQLIDVELGEAIGPLSLIAPAPKAPVLLSLCLWVLAGVIAVLEVVNPSTTQA